MKRTICLVLGVSLMPVAGYAEDKKAGELTDPLEILKKVDAAAKAVKAVKYDVVVVGTGALAARVGKLKGSVIASGVVQGAPQKYLIDVTVTQPGSAETKRLTGGSDGDMFFVVDHQAKKAYEDIDPAVMGSAGRTLRAGMMIEFLHPAPFSDEINGKKQELTGSKTIGGEDCYEIHVVYAAAQASEATWYFSKKDFLPRGRTDVYKDVQGEGGTVEKMITNLVVDPKFDKDAFKLKLPAGYTKTDDFAP